MESQHHRRRVLVVEDDRDIRGPIEAVVRSAGYDVATAEHGEEALDVLRRVPNIDLILLDLRMPVLDGWAFLEIRRSHPMLARIPVVLLTAMGGPSRTSPYIGISAVLSKPLDLDEVVDSVGRFMGAVPEDAAQ